jgi:hypothetical protein
MPPTPQESFDRWLDQIIGPLPLGEGEDHATDEGPSRPSGFLVDDDGKADWLCRRIARLQAEITERAAFVRQQIDQLQQWQAALDATAQRSLFFFEGLARGYYERLRDTGKITERRRSYALPHGTLQMRAVSIAFEVVDEAAFADWCGEHGLAEIIIKPMWREAKQQFVGQDDQVGAVVVVESVDHATGEVTRQVVPGVHVSRATGERFSVRLREGPESPAASREIIQGGTHGE